MKNFNSVLLKLVLILFFIFQSQIVYAQDDSLVPFFTKLTGFSDEKGNIVIPLKYENAGNFSEGLAWVVENSKFGFIDKNDQIVISAKYDFAEDFNNGSAIVEVNGKYGLIDKTGEEIIPIKYDDCKRFSEGLAPVRAGTKWGFIDETGLEKISPQYDQVDDFSENLAGVDINDKWGFINKTGQMIIKPQFYSTCQFSEGLAFVYQNDKQKWEYLLIDKQGNVISSIDMYVDNKPKFINGFALFTRSSGAPPLCANKIVNKKGITVYEEHIQYPPPVELNPNQEHQTEVVVDDLTSHGISPATILFVLKPTFVVKKPELKKIKTETKTGFVNQQGEIVIKPEYDGNYCEWIEPNCFWVKKDKIVFLIDHGKSTPLQIDFLKNTFWFDCGDGIIKIRSDKKIGLVDKYGNTVVEPKYDDIEAFSEDLAAFKMDDKIGYLNRNGGVVIPPQFTDEYPFPKFSEDMAAVCSGGRWGYVNKNGKMVISPQFLSASPFNDSFAYVTTNEKEFDETIDKQGKVIAEFHKQFIRAFKDGLASAYDKELKKSGYIDKSGNWAIKPIYTWASDFSDGLALVENNDNGIKKSGFINTTGTFAFDPYSGHCWSDGFYDGLAIVKSKDGESVIDQTGRVIVSSNNRSEDFAFDQTGIITMKSKSGSIKYFDKKVIYFSVITTVNIKRRLISWASLFLHTS